MYLLSELRISNTAMKINTTVTFKMFYEKSTIISGIILFFLSYETVGKETGVRVE